MEFKRISLRASLYGGDEDTHPTGRIYVNIEELVREAREALIDARGSERTTFFDMVPEGYREHVDSVAQKAYQERSMVLIKYRDFREIIAENWLLKRSVFIRISAELGFSQVPFIKHDADLAALMLTISGSIVAVSQPDENGVREITYIRIKERENVTLPSSLNSALFSDVSIGSSLVAFGLTTSNVMYISFVESADRSWLRMIAATLTSSFEAVNEYTRTKIVTLGRGIAP